ncbi:MetS family NSS transporter small subunit [Romboutsia lituseburensis]|uniref:MetS family NSS transporter small subunit n=1 Tax=Romboutsia lituseburensis DSM 797 TaxID=1121325 RepID=A0A1G9S001_9FIRM|nr:MetS family NSS transporter small subunit [Romboutsia lituseburensis]CEH32854.1 Hypothetical protein RLITU_0243 [Romboutsia lituseburensis]SDM28075.1 hypothetical protein SAMN04515677_1089 [Romboutsia lituseburensis DSM 797]
MTSISIVFFLLGATILWGGFMVTLAITIKNERKTN